MSLVYPPFSSSYPQHLLSFFIGDLNGMIGSGAMESPFLRLYVKNSFNHVVEVIQETPDAILQTENSIFFGSTYRMQTPIEYLELESTRILIEFHRQLPQSNQHELLSWTYLSMQDMHFRSGMVQTVRLTMYATPIIVVPSRNNQEENLLCPMPGGALLELDLNIRSF